MHSFCTLFDKNYLYQGVVLYQSLLKHAKDFNLYVLCMDGITFETISKLSIPNLIPIQLAQIETAEVLKVKARVTHGQFCWVCQPLICLFILEHYKVDMVTYLEADSMFFHDPGILLNEMTGHSASLVPHRFTPQFDNTRAAGRYCVQFNAFRNSTDGLKVLNYWKNCCFLYSREKPRYYPGQLSLNDWSQRFKGVKEITHLGAGVAPWNVQQFKVTKAGQEIRVGGTPLIFYHYHSYACYSDGSHDLGSYPLAKSVVNNIYRPYIAALRNARKWICEIDPNFNYQRVKDKSKTLMDILKSANLRQIAGHIYAQAKRALNGVKPIYPDSYFED